MGLNTKTKKQYIEKAFWGVLAVLATIFLLKTASWEDSYYTRMEGTDRAVAVSSAPAVEEIEIDETEPTEEEVKNWAATLPEKSYPAYITIDALHAIGRQVIPIGVTANGSLDTPRNVYQIGWYKYSSAPGEGGTLVLDGHNGGPNVEGILKHLPDVAIGEHIYIENADGESFSYRVVENISVPLAESDAYMRTAFSSPVPGQESLTIITCTGEWSQVRGTYLSRQFLRAVLEN